MVRTIDARDWVGKFRADYAHRSPIAKGVLARPHGEMKEGNRAGSDRHVKGILVDSSNPEPDKQIIDRVEEVAKKRGVSMAVVATSWVRSKGCTPIVGCNSVKRIEDAARGIQFCLTEDEKKYLEEAYRAKPVSGY